jgi:hypothetical protein
MMLKKIIGAGLIFTLLFTGAWKLEHAHKRTFIRSVAINPQLSEVMPINQLQIPFGDQPFEEFKAREYVRILGIFNDKQLSK